MKKFYILLFASIFQLSNAQTTIFSENMGAPTATVAISANTFQNATPITFSGTADVRITTPSIGYTGASGNGSIFVGATIPSQTFLIEGINTTNYSNIEMSFGHYKSTNAGSNELTVEVSSDGTNWTPLTYSRATGTATSNWILITPTGTIPATSNLRIKFTNPTNSGTALSVGFRVDDVKLTGTSLSVKDNAIAGLKVYPNPVTNGKFFIATDSNTEKTVAIFDVLGKQVVNTKVLETVNVSNLKSGVYIIKITEESKTATRKLVIK